MALDLTAATTLQTLQALENREVSSVELLDAMIGRIETHNATINAVVAQDLDRARAEAVAADDIRGWGSAGGALHGLPMTIKDTYETIDLTTTAGAPQLASHLPDKDATVVRLLRRAGAIVWAKTNVPLMAGDHQSFNEVYGRTNNPWDPERTAGGSSGGAAAAVACGFTTAEVGSDIGGSIRQPAAHNGVFGLKTTHGLVGHRGHIPGAPGSVRVPDLGVFGPIARSCGDLRLLLQVLTLSTTAYRGVPGASMPRFSSPPDIVNLRIGLWLDDPMSPVDAAVRDVLASAVERLADAGAQIVEGARPSIDAESLHNTYMTLLSAEMSTADSDEDWRSLAALADGNWDHTDDPLLSHARRTTIPHRLWLAADEARWKAVAAWTELFESVDCVLAPVSPVEPFPHTTELPYGKRTLSVNGEDLPYGNQLFWAGLATMPLLPALAMPAGHTPGGLPIGMQLIGPAHSDHRLLSMGEEITSVLGNAFVAPPLVAS